MLNILRKIFSFIGTRLAILIAGIIGATAILSFTVISAITPNFNEADLEKVINMVRSKDGSYVAQNS